MMLKPSKCPDCGGWADECPACYTDLAGTCECCQDGGPTAAEVDRDRYRDALQGLITAYGVYVGGGPYPAYPPGNVPSQAQIDAWESALDAMAKGGSNG
jgi:hypothetical protein